jgi:hypothetical protein
MYYVFSCSFLCHPKTADWVLPDLTSVCESLLGDDDTDSCVTSEASCDILTFLDTREQDVGVTSPVSGESSDEVDELDATMLRDALELTPSLAAVTSHVITPHDTMMYPDTIRSPSIMHCNSISDFPETVTSHISMTSTDNIVSHTLSLLADYLHGNSWESNTDNYNSNLSQYLDTMNMQIGSSSSYSTSSVTSYPTFPCYAQ